MPYPETDCLTLVDILAPCHHLWPHVTDPWRDFQYLTVCPPSHDLTAWVRQVTSLGRNQGAAAHMGHWTGPLTPHGVLQVCLLCTEPFKAPEADQVWDLRFRKGEPHLCPCPTRPLLVEGLASALHRYERARHMLDQELQEWYHQAIGTLPAMTRLLQISLLLRAHEQLSADSPLKGRRGQTLRYMHETFVGIGRSLTVDDVRRALRPVMRPLEHEFFDSLLVDMYVAFHQHGPQRYPKAAVYDAMARFLVALGVLKGTADALFYDLAERLRKRLQRAHL